VTPEGSDKPKDVQDVWIVMADDKTGEELVYDISGSLDEHPGGVEILLEEAGKCFEVDGSDATEMFTSIGHTTGAKKTRDKYVIGKLKVDPSKPKVARKSGGSKTLASEGGGLSMTAVLFVLLAIAGGLYYQYVLNK